MIIEVCILEGKVSLHFPALRLTCNSGGDVVTQGHQMVSQMVRVQRPAV